MFCTQCGTPNSDELTFCTNCSAPLVKRDTPRTPRSPDPWQGTSAQPPESQYPTPQPPPQPYSGYQSAYSSPQGYQQYQSPSSSYQAPLQEGGASGRAIASMILSILAPFTCGVFLSVPGMILGKMEMNAIRDGRAPKAGETVAKIGFYLGLVVTVLFCLVLLFFALLVFGSVMSSFPSPIN